MGRREGTGQRLWIGTALSVLAEPTADLGIVSGKQMRALLRVTVAALRYTIGSTGPTGAPITAEDVMDEVSGIQQWLSGLRRKSVGGWSEGWAGEVEAAGAVQGVGGGAGETAGGQDLVFVLVAAG